MIIRCNGSEETVAFHLDAVSSGFQHSGQSRSYQLCFALANDKRFFSEEEAKMARDFGDLMGCVVRKFRGDVRLAGCPVSMRPRPEESEADCRKTKLKFLQ
jgi:hypothetical protein